MPVWSIPVLVRGLTLSAFEFNLLTGQIQQERVMYTKICEDLGIDMPVFAFYPIAATWWWKSARPVVWVCWAPVL